MTVALPTPVTFYFDPACPWTWLTSRWLVEVAEERGLDVQWRPLSLLVLNGGIDNAPEQWRRIFLFSRDALRVVQALVDAGENERIGSLYTALGTRRFVEDQPPSRELIADAAREAGVEAFLPALDNEGLDAAIEGSTHEAVELGGPDVGSPILRLGDRGIFGPIVSPAPRGEDALRLWDSLTTLSELGSFYEIKRGRRGGPEVRSA